MLYRAVQEYNMFFVRVELWTPKQVKHDCTSLATFSTMENHILRLDSLQSLRNVHKPTKIKNKAIFLGIAYSFQKSVNIPTNKHDFKLDYIFTERGIISSN